MPACHTIISTLQSSPLWLTLFFYPLPQFQVLPSEAQAIISAITKDPTPLYSKGVTLNKSKYLFVRLEPGRAVNCRRGNEGAVAIKTNKCLLIGGYTEGMQAGSCWAVLEKLAEYFRANGY